MKQVGYITVVFWFKVYLIVSSIPYLPTDFPSIRFFCLRCALGVIFGHHVLWDSLWRSILICDVCLVASVVWHTWFVTFTPMPLFWQFCLRAAHFARHFLPRVSYPYERTSCEKRAVITDEDDILAITRMCIHLLAKHFAKGVRSKSVAAALTVFQENTKHKLVESRDYAPASPGPDGWIHRRTTQVHIQRWQALRIQL